MTIAYSALKKKLWNKQFFIILAAEELFQHTLGHKSMKHVNAYFYIYIYMYMCIAYSALKKKCRFSFSSRYHLQLHWSCWRAVPGHLGLWLHGTWCQYHLCMCLSILLRKKREFHYFSCRYYLQILSAAALKLLTNCSSAPWVMDAWNLMSILLLYVYICLLPKLL